MKIHYRILGNIVESPKGRLPRWRLQRRFCIFFWYTIFTGSKDAVTQRRNELQ